MFPRAEGAFEAGHNLLLLDDTGLEIRFASAQLANLLGADVDDLVGRPIETLFAAPPDQARWRLRARRGGELTFDVRVESVGTGRLILLTAVAPPERPAEAPLAAFAMKLAEGAWFGACEAVTGEAIRWCAIDLHNTGASLRLAASAMAPAPGEAGPAAGEGRLGDGTAYACAPVRSDDLCLGFITIGTGEAPGLALAEALAKIAAPPLEAAYLRQRLQEQAEGERRRRELIGHDVGNALTAVVVGAALLDDTRTGRVVKRAVDRLEARFADVLAALDTESVGEPCTPEPVDLEAAWIAAAEAVRRVSRERDVHLARPPLRGGLLVAADGATLRTALERVARCAVLRAPAGDVAVELAPRSGTVRLAITLPDGSAPWEPIVGVAEWVELRTNHRCTCDPGLALARTLTERMGGTLTARDRRLEITLPR